MTAAQTILADLEDATNDRDRFAFGWKDGWICGVTWWAHERYILSFSQRISLDLRAKGVAIDSRPCKRHNHKSTCHEYRLTPIPKQLELGA